MSKNILILNNFTELNPRTRLHNETLKEHGYNTTVINWSRGIGGNSNSVNDELSVELSIGRASLLSIVVFPILYMKFLIVIYKNSIKYDKIICNNILLLPVGIMLKIVAKKSLIFDVQEDYLAQYKSRNPIEYKIGGIMLKLLERLMLQLVDGILVIDTKNSYLKDRYKMYCSNVKSTKNVPLSKPLSSKHKINSTIFTVIYVGRIAEKRGVLTLARAVIYMINNGEEVKLITIGKDINNTKNKIRHIFEANNSRKHLKMEPPVPYEEVHRELAHGDVALAPYTDTWEYQQARGNSRKIFDYMMAGIPIIGPDFSGIGQLIKDIDSGLVVDTTSKVAIAEAILKLKNDPELCEKYSRNGRKAIEQTYNWSVESERLLNVVDNS